jgi:hypothetical protein
MSAAYSMATYPGVGSAFAAQQGFAAFVYATLSGANTLAIPGIVNSFSSANLSNPSSFYSGLGNMALHIGPNIIGGYTSAIKDAFDFSTLVINTLGSAATNLFSNSVQTATQQFNSTLSNSESGSSGGGGGGGSGSPNQSSLWVTPSGAVVTFGGQLVSAPPSKH